MQIKYPSQSPERMKVYRDKWAAQNKDTINAAKRKRRLKKKIKSLKGKQCLNCDILMVERCKGTRIYCESCVKNYPIEVRRHRWRRYYNRSKGKSTPTIPLNTHYIVSWKTLKQHGNS